MPNRDPGASSNRHWQNAALVAPLLASLLAFSSCGGGSNATKQISGAAGSGAAGTGSSGTGTAGTSGTAGAQGGGGSSGAGTTGTGTTGGAACINYCTTIMTNCKGANQQYADMANCMKVCSYMPAGNPTDTGVNSVGCRTNKATAAANDAMANKIECLQAGPNSYGACGNDCDTFCAVATSYCSTAGGYNGTAPYKSMDDCENLCGQFQRVLDPGLPGSYDATYTPGATTETKDTLECRAYHLFINALASTTNQTAHCPHAANMSDPCGPGVQQIDVDAGTTGDGGGGPAYDGGLVHVLNSTTWNETMYPPDKRKMLLRDEGDPHLVMIDLSKTPILQWKTVAGGPWARAAQLIGNNQILGGRNDGYEVFDYTTGAIVKQVKTFSNTQSAYRTVTGETMLTRSGTILTFLDKNDQVSHQISYPGYGYVRVARPTRNGTYLVPSDTKLFEGDATGKVLWSVSGSGWSHIWEPLLLGPSVGTGKWNDGDVLLCTAFGSSCDVVDKTSHKVTFQFGGKAMPNAGMIKPNFFSEYEILPNGNIFVSNWQGHGGGNGGSGIQVLEFDPTGKVVWYWKQDPTIFSSIQGVQVMDGKDPKRQYVQETSPDSTWQPVQ
jgi:hypothetical protein